MAKLTEESKLLIEDMIDHLKFRLRNYPLKLKYIDNRFPDKLQNFCIIATHNDGRIQCLHRPVNTLGLNAKWNAEYFEEQFCI